LLIALLAPTPTVGTPPATGGPCHLLDYGDLPVATFPVGTSFVTGGVTVHVREIYFNLGPCMPPTFGNFVRTGSGFFCNTGMGLGVINANLDYDFGTPVTEVIVPYGEVGGFVSLAINGDCLMAANFTDFDGTVLGGVGIEVVLNGQPGQSCGLIVLNGKVDDLVVGGNEVFFDNLRFCRQCPLPLRAGFEDVPLGTTFPVGATFTSGNANCAIRAFFPPPGPTCADPFAGGFAHVVGTSMACGAGQELLVNNVNVAIDFGVAIDRLVLSFAEIGGNVNLMINGECRNVANLSMLNGTLLGGVEVLAIDFVAPGQGCGMLYALGPITDFMIGGQELWIDQVRACELGVTAADDGGTPAESPVRAVLEQNIPNPFNPSTTIAFELAASAQTKLEVFDAGGRHVRSLLDGAIGRGRHEVVWDGLDERGVRVPSGVYRYRLTAAGLTTTKSMIVLK
jgi:hypothetical protein